MREIQCSKGYVALVDDEDYERINAFSWFSIVTRGHVSPARWAGKKNGKRICQRMAHEVLGLAPGSGTLIDHKNREPLDNQKHNLREADKKLNAQNTDRVEFASGIYFDKGRNRFKAFLLSGDCNVPRKYLGTFRQETDAVAALAEAKARG